MLTLAFAKESPRASERTARRDGNCVRSSGNMAFAGTSRGPCGIWVAPGVCNIWLARAPLEDAVLFGSIRCPCRPPGRFDGTHGNVLKVHTAFFVSARRNETYTHSTAQHDTTTTTRTAQPKHITQQHNINKITQHRNTLHTQHTWPLSLSREREERDI